MGFDLTANGQLNLNQGWGTLGLGIAYNRNDTDVVGQVQTPPILQTLLADPAATLFDREQTSAPPAASPGTTSASPATGRWAGSPRWAA